MNKNILIQEWLDHSRKDLDSAVFLTKMMPEPLEIICFHCQQSVEKALKAYLSFLNLRPRTDNKLPLKTFSPWRVLKRPHLCAVLVLPY